MKSIPVSLSKKVHLKNGNGRGEFTETRLDDEFDSAMNDEKKRMLSERKKQLIEMNLI
jgi:hypothetical protein